MTKKKQTTIRPEVLDELLQGCSALPTQEDLFGPEGVIKQLSKALMERCLEAELSTHLGYEKHERGTEEKTNLRNGFSRKSHYGRLMEIYGSVLNGDKTPERFLAQAG